jgi:hypothetical protein
MPTNNLPSNVSSTALPALIEQCNQIERMIAPLRRLAEAGSIDANGAYCPIPDEAEAQQTLAAAQRAHAAWPLVSRPATADQIATQVGLLQACFLNHGKSEREIFTRVLCADLADERPSLFVLQATCRRVRQRRKFLSIAEVFDELHAANRQAKQVQRLLDALPHMQRRWDSNAPPEPDDEPSAADQFLIQSWREEWGDWDDGDEVRIIGSEPHEPPAADEEDGDG